MSSPRTQATQCKLCGQIFQPDELLPGEALRPRVARLIKCDHPGWNDSSSICLADLNGYRMEYVPLQAPIIMMSQNRQESRDRLRAESDYKTNLKAELENRNLSEKVDHLLRKQSQRLLEIQQIQLDLMRDLATALPRGHGQPSMAI